MGLLIAYLLLALGVSFLCSIMEAVLLSVSMPYITKGVQEGKPSARALLVLKNKIDRPLSAILSINTVAHTVGAAGVGAQAVAIFGEVYFGLISAVLTILILVFSEIIPKTIGAQYWRTLALPSARIIQGMIYVSYPLVILAEFITRLFMNKDKPHSISREELSVMAQLGTKEGVFEENESKMIHNLIRLQSIKTRDIMTPRTVLMAAKEDISYEEFMHTREFMRYSRIPVYSESLDDITGYVLKTDALEKMAKDMHDVPIKEIKRPILIYYENFPVPRLFEQLLISKEHIALIIDEYGGTQGLVTMEDIIETILGLEIVDEKDTETDMQKLARRKWRLRTGRLRFGGSSDLKKGQ